MTCIDYTQLLAYILLTGKESTDWLSLLGNKPVITQVHSYDILVINTHPRLRLGLV